VNEFLCGDLSFNGCAVAGIVVSAVALIGAFCSGANWEWKSVLKSLRKNGTYGGADKFRIVGHVEKRVSNETWEKE
jgi:hypothetical protein